jgi:hypothetical protein
VTAQHHRSGPLYCYADDGFGNLIELRHDTGHTLAYRWVLLTMQWWRE